ncbi:MAG: exodeoxyribonuclease III [Gammaproteobacteria bacterium]|nr:exodeoxyribonuclease III [Gammaproteobacteria bacterium]
MKIATWNVNSLRARLPHLTRWLATAAPDILALQETKVVDADFPGAEIEALGYQWLCSGQKSYNGVAVLSRTAMTPLFTTLEALEDPQRRVLAVQVGSYTVLDLYVPNGASVGSDKYAYKLAWLDRLVDTVARLLRDGRPTIVLGDFNIAPEDRDVHDPAAWTGSVLVSEPERERLRRLLALGLRDGFRLFEQGDDGFTWWDYRGGSFRRNHGLRIDLVLLDGGLAARCRRLYVDREPRRWEKPSDHAPVVAEFDD